MRSASLRELNSKSSALVRLAARGEVVVITDRGVPIVDLVPHRGRPTGTPRAEAERMFERFRNSNGTALTSDAIRADLDDVVDPYLD